MHTYVYKSATQLSLLFKPSNPNVVMRSRAQVVGSLRGPPIYSKTMFVVQIFPPWMIARSLCEVADCWA